MKSIAALEARVAKLEAEMARQGAGKLRAEAAAQEAVRAQAAAKAAADRNRANALNPACAAFWMSRGYDRAPWNWESLEGSSLEVAHNWPGFLEKIKNTGPNDGWRRYQIATREYGLREWGAVLQLKARADLQSIWDELHN
jgi:hypothetical protein